MDITLYKTEGNLFFKKINSKSGITEDNIDGYLIDSDEKEIRRILDTLKAKKQKKIIAVQGKDDEFNRRIIETTKVNFLVSPEFNPGSDTLKQRDSGINHVVAKAAAKNKISLIIDFSRISKLADKKEKAKILARVMQNLKVCRRANCQMKIATFAERKEDQRSERELKAFLFSLGASSQQTSEATSFS